MDHFRFFAYVTKDTEEKGYFNCHVFSACNLEMTNEILITLAQSFEIAFRLTNGETIDQLRKHYVRSKLNNQSTNNETKPNPPPRLSSNLSSYSLNRNLNLSKSLSESQFNQLLISVANGFRSNNRKLKSNQNKDTNESIEEQSYRPKQVISASNSIKSIKSIKSENNFLNRRKSLQSSHLTSQLNSLNNLNHLNNLIKPIKPPFKHQTSLPENHFKLNLLNSSSNGQPKRNPINSANRPQIPKKPLIIKR